MEFTYELGDQKKNHTSITQLGDEEEEVMLGYYWLATFQTENSIWKNATIDESVDSLVIKEPKPSLDKEAAQIRQVMGTRR